MAEPAFRSSPLAWRFFEAFFAPWMDRRVRIHLAGASAAVEPGFPVLLVANHESWWDGFVLRRVQRVLRPASRFHAVMLERELTPRPFLRLLGGIGIDPASVASVRGLLRAARRLRREDPTGVLAYFPQGVMRPGSPRPLGFRSGVVRVAEALAPVTVLPVALRVLPGVTPRQECYVSLGQPLAVVAEGGVTVRRMEAAVAEELDAIDAFLELHGEAAPDRWPGPALRLPRAPEPTPLVDDVGSWISRN